MKILAKVVARVLLSTASLVLLPQEVQANDRSIPCDPCECAPCNFYGCNIEVGIDFLWWKPCVDDLEYAAEDVSPEGLNKRFLNHKSVCTSWEPGVRVFLNTQRAFCDFGLHASYTYNCSDAKSSITGDPETIISSLIHPGIDHENQGDKAKGSWEAEYHEWDLLVRTSFCPRGCHAFIPFLGLAGIVYDQKFSSALFDIENKPDDDSDTSKWTSDFWGVGFRAGTEYEYRISSCLSFYGLVQGTLLAGNADSGYDFELEIDDREDLDTDDHECCQFVPGYHIALGLNYGTCACGWDITARLGYEFLWWHNLPRHRVYTTSGDGNRSHATSRYARNIGFHGLFAGAAVTF